jgi:hypothetical protein
MNGASQFYYFTSNPVDPLEIKAEIPHTMQAEGSQ